MDEPPFVMLFAQFGRQSPASRSRHQSTRWRPTTSTVCSASPTSSSEDRVPTRRYRSTLSGPPRHKRAGSARGGGRLNDGAGAGQPVDGYGRGMLIDATFTLTSLHEAPFVAVPTRTGFATQHRIVESEQSYAHHPLNARKFRAPENEAIRVTVLSNCTFF